MFTKVDTFNSGTHKDEIVSELNDQYNAWKDKLTERFTNYFSISFKYIY